MYSGRPDGPNFSQALTSGNFAWTHLRNCIYVNHVCQVPGRANLENELKGRDCAYELPAARENFAQTKS